MFNGRARTRSRYGPIITLPGDGARRRKLEGKLEEYGAAGVIIFLLLTYRGNACRAMVNPLF